MLLHQLPLIWGHHSWLLFIHMTTIIRIQEHTTALLVQLVHVTCCYLNCSADASCGVKVGSAGVWPSGWISEKRTAAAGLRFHDCDPSQSLF